MKIQKNIKIALICTAGGHFEQMSNLEDFYRRYDHFWITNRNRQTESALENEKKYYIRVAHFKKPWIYLTHFPLILKIFLKEKPTHVLSTGSGRTGFVPFLISKLLYIKFIYVETYSRVNNLTILADFLIKIHHPVLTQWKSERSGAKYLGHVFRDDEISIKQVIEDDYVFVALGTRFEPFTRLLEYLDNLKEKNLIREKIIVQAGHTKYQSKKMEIFGFCPVQRIDELISGAKYVITQESAGITTKCLKYKKKFIVMPREYIHGELTAISDMKEDLQYKLEELGYTRVVKNQDELEEAIRHVDELKTGFKFDNTRAIAVLTKIVENS